MANKTVGPDDLSDLVIDLPTEADYAAARAAADAAIAAGQLNVSDEPFDTPIYDDDGRVVGDGHSRTVGLDDDE